MIDKLTAGKVRPLKEKKLIPINRKSEFNEKQRAGIIFYFSTIENLVIANWFKLHTADDIKFLCVEDPGSLSVKQSEFLDSVFESITDKYIDTFGISDEYRQILELRSRINGLRAMLIRTEDRSIENLIDMAEADLKELIGEPSKDTGSKLISYVAKEMGFRIDENTVSVKEFYGYVDLIKTLRHAGQKNK